MLWVWNLGAYHPNLQGGGNKVGDKPYSPGLWAVVSGHKTENHIFDRELAGRGRASYAGNKIVREKYMV